MVFATNLCLAAACITALVSLGQGQSFCTTISWGTPNSDPHPLPVSYLAPRIQDFKVQIPDHPACIGKDVVSLVVTVCDTDSTPIAKFENYYLVDVHRTGSLRGTGTVTATEYCQPRKSGLGSGPGQEEEVGGLVAVPA